MNIAKYIDHTLINPEAKKKNIKKLCAEAIENKFRAICINAGWIYYARTQLKGTDIKIISTLNFPTSKSTNMEDADEIDYFLDTRLCDSPTRLMEIEKVVRMVKTYFENTPIKKTVKFVVNTEFLNTSQLYYVCRLLKKNKVYCIKNSSGLFPKRRTNLQDLTIIKKAVNKFMLVFKHKRLFVRTKEVEIKGKKFKKNVGGIKIIYPTIVFYKPKIKIAGGIKDRKEAEELIRKGTDYLGTSKGTEIIKEPVKVNIPKYVAGYNPPPENEQRLEKPTPSPPKKEKK